MCGCAIFNTSKYIQESLNAWRRKQLKIMKDIAENSRGRGKDELTQAHKSYADYAFPEKERSIVSLIITSFVLEFLAPSKPPSSGEAMSSL